ncbi:MAG: flippase [Candidatus Pacebacteria bacterium]|nr:flippase [Candidatus Paceibacterota bacterium]
MNFTKTVGFQKYMKSAGWMFFAKIAGLGLSFFVSAYIIRSLGPVNYGELSYAVSFVGLFSFIASLGIDQVVYRDLIKFPDERKKYLGTGLIIKIFAGIIATLLCLMFAFLSSTSGLSLLLILILSLTFLFNAFGIVVYEFYARVKNKYPSLISLAVIILLNVLKIVTISSGKGVIYIAFILLLEPVVTSALLIFLYKKECESIFELTFDKNIAKSLIRDSWPLIFSSAFALIYARIDQVLIKHMLDTASVGIYDSAVRISEGWYFIPSIIVSTFFPAIVIAKSNSDVEYNKRLGRLALVLFFISVSVALPVTFFAKFIMYLL